MTQPAAALLVRFQSALSHDELMRIVETRIDAFRALTGLEQKYYLHDATTNEYAGLYLWKSEAELTEFSKSELRASIAEAYQAIGEPRVEVYKVEKLLHQET